jgi:hypothetical protein
MKTLLRILLLFPLLFLSSCKKEESNPVQPNAGGTGGKIATGAATEVARQTVPSSGGTMVVNQPGNPLDGFELTVPLNGFTQAQDFAVSYAEITSHQFGADFNPISPLIKISYDGGYSADMMSVKIPIKLPDGHFAMGFFYDEATQSLEPIPVEDLDSNFITLSTRHLSPANATLGKSFLRKPQGIFGNLVISSALATLLDGQPTLSSGFRPGVDDWEFVNYGSYIASGGHCAGQSMTAMWYFYEKKLKGEPSLNHRFDTVNDPARPDSLWSDNPRGYRFASTIQEDQNFDNWIKSLNYFSARPKLTWYSFIYAMLLTGEPQYVLIRNRATGAGHAMIIYKVTPSTGTLFIADPNYPSNRDPRSGTLSTRIIEYENEQLKPYSSAMVSGGPGVSFDQIGYAAKTTHIKWSKISDRWDEFQNGTIGDDRFPAYKLWARNSGGFELKDTLSTFVDTLELHSRSTAASGWITNTDHLQEFWVYDDRGKYLGGGFEATKGIVRILLSGGQQYRFGFYILGETAGAKKEYVDFRWVDIKHLESEVDFSRVKQVGIALISIDTHWKDKDDKPFDKTFSPSWISDVTLNGNVLSGVSEFGDTVSATVSGSSISFQASGRTTLGSLGGAYASISGTVSPPPTRLEPNYFSYEVVGANACGAVTSLVLNTDGQYTLEGFSCSSTTLFGITFYY